MTLIIKVLGPGCANCENLAKNARAAADALAIDATVEKVTDRDEFARYGLLYTPGLVIDEKLVSGGRIPPVAEITSMLASAVAA
ncbi:MAG: thioredoxin family protein [Caldilineales bacterium]